MISNQYIKDGYFLEECGQIDASGLPADHKFRNLYQLMQLMYGLLASDAQLRLSGFFSKINYIALSKDLPAKLLGLTHHCRIVAEKHLNGHQEVGEQDYKLLLAAFALSAAHYFDEVIPEALLGKLPDESEYPSKRPGQSGARLPMLKAQFIQYDQEKNVLVCKAEEGFEERYVKVRINVFGENDDFLIDPNELWPSCGLQLIGVQVEKDDTLLPDYIILEPDFLINVTDIAECIQNFGTAAGLYLLKKFDKSAVSPAITLGNAANFFLDSLMSAPNLETLDYDSTFKKTFALFPLTYSMFTDEEVKEIYEKGRLHFQNLRTVIRDHFPSLEIDKNNCRLEPGFYSSKYGLSGRLDILHFNNQNRQSDILELKSSGTVPAEGMWANHAAQSALYKLLIEEVYSDRKKGRNFILYSSSFSNPLRYQDISKKYEKKLLDLRNRIIVLEHRMTTEKGYKLGRFLFDQINPDNPDFSKQPPIFIKKPMEDFRDTVGRSGQLAQKYFLAFVNFIAEEHHIAKLGSPQNDKANGQAGLWTDNLFDKKDSFSIAENLSVVNTTVVGDAFYLRLAREESDKSPLNFRKGDVAVLYPRISADTKVTNCELIRCSISETDEKGLTLKLRNESCHNLFTKGGYRWNVEPDFMDMGFQNMYTDMLAFMKSGAKKRDLLLTASPPEEPDNELYYQNDTLNDEQNRVLNKALAAKDYFLLVGPPGTGKTKVMLKELVKSCYAPGKNQKGRILLMAYTNRAVEEICEAVELALEELGENPKEYVKVGSSMKSSESPNTLAELAASCNTRKELRALLEGKKIYVSTVARASGMPELFALLKFDLLVVDEASQILEPQIVGILSKAGKFILIGDEKQLPAVVTQDSAVSAVADKDLLGIGLNNRRNSLFERMLLRAAAEGWHWAYDGISYQGRMHEVLLEFPNKAYYNGILKTALPWQKQNLVFPKTDPENELQMRLASKRLLFFDVKKDKNDLIGNAKVNMEEARLAAQIVHEFYMLYQQNGLVFDKERTLGVITPFRAQIAQIKAELAAYGKGLENVSIDTVERYQGGQREIIIYSFVISKPFQLDALSSLTDDKKVDRKLNVALTRARQQLVLLGDKNLLVQNGHFGALLGHIGD